MKSHIYRAETWALLATIVLLVSCSGYKDKFTTYTSSFDIVYLNDSLASLVLVDATEKDASMGNPFVEKTELFTYKFNYRKQGTIESWAAPMVFPGIGIPKLWPWVFGNELVLYDETSFFGALVRDGTAKYIATDGCCVNWSKSPMDHVFIIKTRTAEFSFWSELSKGQSPINPDSLFAFKPEKWYDLYYSNGKYFGIFRDSGTSFLVTKGSAPGDVTSNRHILPGMDSITSTFQILIYPGYEVLLRDPSLPQSAEFISLAAVLGDSINAVWKTFSRKRSFDQSVVYEIKGDTLSFKSLESNAILSKYDLSKFIKPQP